MAYEYIKQAYGVQPKAGMRVRSKDGKYSGEVARCRLSHAHYVYVRIDGRNHAEPFHPLDLIYSKAGE